jgi:hypothetical protein
MTRARTVVLAAVSLVVAGVLLAVAARSADTRPVLLPPEAAVLPMDASFVAAIDLTRVIASPLFERITRNPEFRPPAVWAELQRNAGLTPERDFRQIVVAGQSGDKGTAVALLLGTFERKRLAHALGASPMFKGREYKGQTLWIAPPSPKQPKESAFAVIGDGALVLGPTEAVTAALDRQAAHAPGLLGNAGILALVQQVKPGSAFWMCGDQGVMAAAANVSPAAGGFSMPSVRSLVASGDVTPDLSLLVVAETPDAPAAKAMAGTLEAIVGLLALQGDRPELKELIAGLDVSHEGTRVRVSARARYDTLEKLMARPTPSPAPTAAPRSRPDEK